MLSPRHILITGASSGLGAALALAYAAPGICLSLHGRHADRIEDIARQARAKGAEISIHLGDVTHAADIERWIAIRDAECPLDLVIANAGISAGTARGCEGAAQAKAIFAVNVDGVFNTVLPALGHMIKRKTGQIAIISSLAGFRGLPGAPAYCASKAAIRIYGEALRAEARRHNVAVNVVCPGFIQTPMTDGNPFPMPFLMAAEPAARLIRRGLSINRPRIAFPWPLYFLVRLLAALPQPLIDFIAARSPKK